MQAARNFEVSKPLSILCGALDLQIEHHLFPKWPPNRLREVAPQARAICERHGVRYQSDTWGRTLSSVFRRLRQLSRPTATPEVAKAVKAEPMPTRRAA